MINKAIVNRVEDNDIYLMHVRDYGRKEKTERNFWNIKTRDFKAVNPENILLSPGDIVEFFIPEGKTILASFIVLILPVIVFILSFLITSLLGLSSDKLKALISIVLMISSFYIFKLLKKAGYKESLPVIIKKIKKSTMKDLKKECRDCGSCTACD